MRPDVILDVFSHWKRKQFRMGRSFLTDCKTERNDPVPREAGTLHLAHDTRKILGTSALYWK